MWKRRYCEVKYSRVRLPTVPLCNTVSCPALQKHPKDAAAGFPLKGYFRTAPMCPGNHQKICPNQSICTCRRTLAKLMARANASNSNGVIQLLSPLRSAGPKQTHLNPHNQGTGGAVDALVKVGVPTQPTGLDWFPAQQEIQCHTPRPTRQLNKDIRDDVIFDVCNLALHMAKAFGVLIRFQTLLLSTGRPRTEKGLSRNWTVPPKHPHHTLHRRRSRSGKPAADG